MTIEEKLAFYQDRYDRLLDPDLWILSGTLFFGPKLNPNQNQCSVHPLTFLAPMFGSTSSFPISGRLKTARCLAGGLEHAKGGEDGRRC